MTASRIMRPETAFSVVRQRRPRQKAGDHLAFLRELPCSIPDCLKRDIHAAHIRSASPIHGKRAVGASEKPDDAWCVPLCLGHHIFDQHAQHAGNELAFWASHGIDPFALALSLWRVTGDESAGAEIIAETQRRRSHEHAEA